MYPHYSMKHKYLTYLIKYQIPVYLHLRNGCKYKGILVDMTEEMLFFRQHMLEVFHKNMIYGVYPITSSS